MVRLDKTYLDETVILSSLMQTRDFSYRGGMQVARGGQLGSSHTRVREKTRKRDTRSQ